MQIIYANRDIFKPKLLSFAILIKLPELPLFHVFCHIIHHLCSRLVDKSPVHAFGCQREERAKACKKTSIKS